MVHQRCGEGQKNQGESMGYPPMFSIVGKRPGYCAKQIFLDVKAFGSLLQQSPEHTIWTNIYILEVCH
jgi:hypothetical protein